MKLAARNKEKKKQRNKKKNNEKQRGKVSATQESLSHPEKDEWRKLNEMPLWVMGKSRRQGKQVTWIAGDVLEWLCPRASCIQASFTRVDNISLNTHTHTHTHSRQCTSDCRLYLCKNMHVLFCFFCRWQQEPAPTKSPFFLCVVFTGCNNVTERGRSGRHCGVNNHRGDNVLSRALSLSPLPAILGS